MKFFLIIGLLLITSQLLGQNLNGSVRDEVTRLPIQNVQVITVSAVVLTDNFGKFNLTNLKTGDHLAFRLLGYETKELTISNLKDSVHIFLKQSIFQLNEVMVKTNRNYKLDSLRLRKEYASVFAYKAPSFTNMFVNVDPNYRPPLALVKPNSTASIVNLNVLQVFSLLGRKKNATAKLKQILLKSEETNYVDHLFTKEKVTDITKLKGDSLNNFMNKYRPSILNLKKMTGYELLQYIKKSYAEFIKP